MKRNESKALARAKRLYQRVKDVPLFKKDKYGRWRACESVTEFLSMKWVKIFGNSKLKRGVSDKLDAKQKNRKERHSEKKIIEEGIQEYNSRYDDTCGNCEFIKDCDKYADDEICENFRD